MTADLAGVLAAAWALRWIFVAIAFVVLGAMYADALHSLRRRNEENAALALELAVERRRVAIFRAHISKHRHRAPIIAGRVVS